MSLFKTIKSLPMAVAAAAVLAVVPMPEGTPIFGEQAAHAQRAPSDKQKTRKVPAMSVDIHKQIQKAQEAMDAKGYAEAKEILADTLERKKINDYERAVAWQLRAMISYEEDDVNGTISAYEQILRYADSIPEALELSILYGLAQLYYSEENYDKALEYVTQWKARTDPTLIGVNQLTFISNLHYVRNEFEEALSYIYEAIEMAKTVDTIEVKESWYQLALSGHWELGEFEKVRDTLEILLLTWPKPQYWIQLAGIYQELGDEPTSYSLTEAAYKQGFLDDKEAQLVNVAQIQLARGAPIKCAWILKKAFEESRVPSDAKNQKTLGQCYMMASEYQKAIGPLTEAAKSDEDGDLWFQIGQVHMQLGQYKEAVESFDSVVSAFRSSRDEKDKSKVLTAVMQKGQALTELKRFTEATAAFKEAKRLSTNQKERRTVTQWEKYLQAEKAREDMLTGR